MIDSLAQIYANSTLKEQTSSMKTYGATVSGKQTQPATDSLGFCNPVYSDCETGNLSHNDGSVMKDEPIYDTCEP